MLYMYLLFYNLIFILKKKKNNIYSIKLLVIKFVCFKIIIEIFTCNIIKYAFKN